MKNFRTLDLAISFFENVERLKLKGHLRDQLERAASSIALNLSEGNAKRTVPEKKRYYQMAYASTQECRTILKLAHVKNLHIHNQADQLGAYLYNLLKSEIPTIPFSS